MRKFIFRAPLNGKPKTLREHRARKFAEPSKEDLAGFRKSWKKHAPEKAKSLYLK